MIRYQDQITRGDTPIFTRIGLDTPLQEALSLPADACYLYIENGSGHTLLDIGNIVATKGTVILSSCGLTVGNMISTQPRGEMDTEGLKSCAWSRFRPRFPGTMKSSLR